MPRLEIAFAALAATFCAQSAQACIAIAPRELADVVYADVVVVGTIADYEIVRDMEFREQMLQSPGLTDDQRKIYADPEQGLMSDYARFDIEVSEWLKGEGSDRIAATWDNSTFGEPDMLNGVYLLALRDPASPVPPLRGPSANIGPAVEPDRLTLLQAPCAPPFLFPIEEAPLEETRAILRGQGGGPASPGYGQQDSSMEEPNLVLATKTGPATDSAMPSVAPRIAILALLVGLASLFVFAMVRRGRRDV